MHFQNYLLAMAAITVHKILEGSDSTFMQDAMIYDSID
jgi:hypothetical protein